MNKTARRLARIAEDVVEEVVEASLGRYSADDVVDSKDMRELEARAKRLKALITPFLEMNSEAIAKAQELDAKKKEIEKHLGKVYTEWPERAEFEVLRDEILEMAERSLDIGDKIKDIVEGIDIVKHQSSQPLYKEKFIFLLSTLNKVESKCFTPVLECFKKTFTEIDLGFKQFKGVRESLDEKAVEFAGKRGIDLFDVLNMKRAGLIGDAGRYIKEYLSGAVRLLSNWARSFFNRIVGTIDLFFKTSDKLDRALDDVNRALERIR